MTTRRKIVLGTIVVLLAALAAAFPYIWRGGALYWAKASARRSLNKLTPEERQNLNATPTFIELPRIAPKAGVGEAVEVGGYLIQVPTAVSRTDKPTAIILQYPQYQVTILRPFSLAESNATARQLQFKNTFDEYAMVYRTRLDDLDAQRDIPSLQRFLLLLSLKIETVLVPGREEFLRDDMSGFIDDPVLNDPKRTVIEIFLQGCQTGCGVWFENQGGLTRAGIHEYLRNMQFNPKPSGVASTTATGSLRKVSL